MTQDKTTNGHGNGSNGNGVPSELLAFPTKVYIKAMGTESARFQALVLSIVSKHIAPEDLLSTSTRTSRGGKYLAVTIVITATSRAQLDAIYHDLSGCKDVLIAL